MALGRGLCVCLLLFSTLVLADQFCQLRLLLNAKNGDGWNDNYLTLTPGGGNFRVTESGNCGYSDRTDLGNQSVQLSLALTAQDAFHLNISYGASLQINYTGLPNNFGDENSWVLELWDIFPPYGAVVLLRGNGANGNTSNTINHVVCGPVPVFAVGTVAVASSPDNTPLSPYVSDISWAGAFKGSYATQYRVSFCDVYQADCTNRDNYRLIGLTPSNHLQAIFPVGNVYQLSVEAYNQFGESPAVILPLSSPPATLPVAVITVYATDTYGDGWADDALMTISFDGIIFASLGFPCNATQAAAAACKSLTYQLYAPAGIDMTLSITFQAPSTGASECGFGILMGANQLDARKDAQGNVIPMVFPVNFLATPYLPYPAVSHTFESDDGALDVVSGSICASLNLSALNPGAPCAYQGTSCPQTTLCSTGMCNTTTVWTCNANSRWETSFACSCYNAPACAAFQALSFTDCCSDNVTASLACKTVGDGSICSGTEPWGDCIGDVDICGKGLQYRVNKNRNGTQCVVTTEQRACTSGCPVNCQGHWLGWTNCSTSCGSGYQTNTYRVDTFAQNGGSDCDSSHGQVSYRQCPDQPDCADGNYLCYYTLDQFDSEGDAWGTARLQTIIEGQAPVNIPWVATDNSLTFSKKTTFFSVPNNTLVQINFVAPTSDKDCIDASYSVTQVLPFLNNNHPFRNILQSPVALQLNVKPSNTNFTSFCVDCTGTDCSSKNRMTCELNQVKDRTCGPCLEGYGLTYGDPKAPGNTLCVDKNECKLTGNTVCAQSGQQCNNLGGTYECYCDGTVIDGHCVAPAPVAFLQQKSELFRRNTLQWAKERLERQKWLRENPAASLAEMESRTSESFRLGLIPLNGSLIWISRCDPTLCPTAYHWCSPTTGTGNTTCWVGDDHSDNLYSDYPPAYAGSSPYYLSKSGNPQTFKVDGGTLRYHPYSDYGEKILRYSTKTVSGVTYNIPYGDTTASSGLQFTFTQDPNSCCMDIGTNNLASGKTGSYSWTLIDTTKPSRSWGSDTTYANNQIIFVASNANRYEWKVFDATQTTIPTAAPTTTTAAPTTTTAAPTTAAPTAAPAATQAAAPAPTTTPYPTTCGRLNLQCCQAPIASCTDNLICDVSTATCLNVCPRVRKEWSEMSLKERDTLIRAFQQLAQMPDGSNYWNYTRMMHNASVTGANDVHGLRPMWFLSWHRFFLWDLETAIRNLGADFRCASLAFWDWSRVAITPGGLNSLKTDFFTNAKQQGTDGNLYWRGVGNIDGCFTTSYVNGSHPFAVINPTNLNYYVACAAQTWYWYNGAWKASVCSDYGYCSSLGGTGSSCISTCPAAAPGYSAYTFVWRQQSPMKSQYVWDPKAGAWVIGSCVYRANTAYLPQETSDGLTAGTGWTAYGPNTMYSNVLSATTYNQFCTQVQGFAHGTMHFWVGGFVGSLDTAAMDPLFFFIHANVDQMWASWQACNNLLNPTAIANQDPRVWDWTNPNTPWGTAMPLFPNSRTPSDAHDITNTNTLGYSYSNSFIQNILSSGASGASKFCNLSTNLTGIQSVLEASSSMMKDQDDPLRPASVVHKSFLEGFMERHEKPKSQRRPNGKNHKSISGAHKKRKQNNRRGTISKVNCYNPSPDEVNTLQSFQILYKKAAASVGHDEAIQVVQDAECSVLDYSNVPYTIDGPLVTQLGLDQLKAAGGLNHECYQKQKGKNAALLTTDYAKKNKASLPTPVLPVVEPYDASFKPMSLTNPPPKPSTSGSTGGYSLPPAPGAPGAPASSTTTANAYGAPAPATYGAPPSNSYAAPPPVAQFQQRREQNSLNPSL